MSFVDVHKLKVTERLPGGEGDTSMPSTWPWRTTNSLAAPRFMSITIRRRSC